MKYLDQFLKHLKDKHFVKSTIESYYYILIRSRKYFDEKGLNDETGITEKDIVEYLAFLKKEKVSYWIYNRSIIYLKIYFKYLEDEKIVFISPLSSIETPKDIRNPTKALSENEIKNILSRINPKNNFETRIKTMLEVLYSTAIRPMELLNLTLNDVDYKKGIIFIRCGKNKKDRIVPIGKTALNWLSKYISDIRSKHLVDKKNSNIFIPHYKTSKKFNYQSFYKTINRFFKKYKIKKFKPYSLRSSSATHLLNNGMSILGIKDLLGHEDIKTTQSYLRIKTLDLQRELRAKHPRDKKKEK